MKKTVTIGHYLRGCAYACFLIGALLAVVGILRLNPWIALVGGILLGRMPSYLRRAEFVAHPDFRAGIREIAEIRELYVKN